MPLLLQRKEKRNIWPDPVSNPGPQTYESGALPTALRSPAPINVKTPTIVGILTFMSKKNFIELSMEKVL